VNVSFSEDALVEISLNEDSVAWAVACSFSGINFVSLFIAGSVIADVGKIVLALVWNEVE
jgi:hypothetical protein